MTPRVFLSLSGQDDKFAKEVWESLPRGLAYFYQKSFETGESLLSEMEKGVGSSQIFVLLASKASLDSPWVGFELTRARIAQIAENIRVLVFPIEADLQGSDFPKWLRDFWISPGIWNPRDIGRYVQDLITNDYLITGPEAVGVIGRGALMDEIGQRLQSAIAENRGSTPNVWFFSGTNQIGRRTVARKFFREYLPAMPNISAGPELNLPQFADLDDIYRGIRSNVDRNITASDMDRALSIFRGLSLEEKMNEICGSLSHFEELGQGVFVYTGSGLFEEDGTPKEWLPSLIRVLSDHPEIFVVFISNRRVKQEILEGFENCVEIHVPALTDENTSALVTATSSAFGEPLKLSIDIVRLIGGHPAIAKAAARISVQRGTATLSKRPDALFGLQESVLSDTLNFDFLSEVQKEILCILSWVPYLTGSVIEKFLALRWADAEDEFVGALEDLVLSSLVVIHSDLYSISNEIRQLFRRKYGFGSDSLLEQFAEALNTEFADREKSGTFRGELFDALVFMTALAGKALPAELKALILPSTLEEVLRQTYARGKDDHQLMEKVLEWATIADALKLDDTVWEAVESTRIQALIRLERFDKADELISQMSERGYRSASFLKGFGLRRRGKLEAAIPYLRDAIKTRKNLRYSVQELATIFHRLGRERDLEELIEEHRDVVGSSASLLDFYIGKLIAENRIDDAERAIASLRGLADDDGRSVIRRAQILSQVDSKHEEALKLLDALIENDGGGVGARRWRGLIASYARDFETAERDIAFLWSRDAQRETAQRLKVHLAIAKGDHRKAFEEFARLDENNAKNAVLLGRILAAAQSDTTYSLVEREQFAARLKSVRPYRGGIDP